MKKDLKAVTKELKRLAQKTEKIIKQFERLEKAQAAKESKAKKVRKVTEIDPILARIMRDKICATDIILAHIIGSRDAIEFIKSTAGGFKEKVEKKGDTGAAQKIVTEIVQRFKKGNIDLPVLPNIVQDIQNVINEPNSTANDVAGALEKDAVISIRLVSMANSPIYRAAEKIYSVKQAVPRLGFKETQNIVTAIANKNLYETKNNQFRITMEKLWQHSLGCAYCSRIIAKKLRFGDAEQIFMMGLLHDIGKPPLLKAVSENTPEDELLPMNDIVASIQEVHTDFGKEILEHWGFAQDFTRIALEHEGPNFSS
ncbi:unnamed protein product, partial [marine sediment metagenome]